MKFLFPTKFKSTKIKDKRGYFQECFKKKNIKFNSIFSAISFSKKNVIRGLHLQLKKKQKIFITILAGKILDVCVDVNIKSKNYGKVYKNILSVGDMLYIPENYAHGFFAIEKKNLIMYQFSNYHHIKSEVCINLFDQKLKIKWPKKKYIISKKDKNGIPFKNFTQLIQK